MISILVKDINNMAKVIKEFTVEEYYKDFKFITNSHLLYFKQCPYFYQQKRKGKVQEIEKDYFTYGKAVDTILSKEDPNEKFFIGTAPKESVEELRECKKILEQEISEREGGGKKPLKSQLTKLDKFDEKISAAQELEEKIKITSTVFVNVMDTAKEIMSQPLYEAFINAENQRIIATEIDGVKVKCIIDKLDLENGIINDDKTTANIHTFNPEMYLPQLAWYRWIVREVFDVVCDCYLSVGDKFSDFKRSSFYYASPARLDYQEELNKELLQDFLNAKKQNNYPTCIDIDGEDMREEKCFKCDYYKYCPYSRQKNFITI